MSGDRGEGYQGLVTKWRKVQDEMPEYDTDLLLWSEAWGHIYVGYWRHSEEWIGRHRPESDESLPDTNPTHWTYFPAPPLAEVIAKHQVSADWIRKAAREYIETGRDCDGPDLCSHCLALVDELAEVIARNVQPSPDDEELRLDGIMASTPSGALDVIAPTYGGISRSNWPARPVQQPAPAQNASRCESCGQPCALGSARVQQPATEPDARRSQVKSFGGPNPKTWADYRKGCLDTYGGGYRSDDGKLAAFHHGIETVFNLLEAEFPPAEQCALALRDVPQGQAKDLREHLTEAIESARDAFRDHDDHGDWPDHWDSAKGREFLTLFLLNNNWVYEAARQVPVGPNDTVEYWKSRATVAELKVLTFHEEIANLKSVPVGPEGKK